MVNFCGAGILPARLLRGSIQVKTASMGITYAEIELIRSDDLALVAAGFIQEDRIRRVRVTALVDSGASMLVIPESIKNQLNLRKVDEQQAELADGTVINMDVVGPIEIRFENRRAIADALVLSGEVEVLLGAIPMQAMDVLIDPKNERLIVNPKSPDKARMLLK
ncbi:clan AA aspartic protease [Argonema antarcticum]|uniref:clan AA aspartic protease n=1 Tax=Argonema antarcticum TaxID=2942763 RepID=UPI002012188C|nr:clan AA aspartic protease [Argonema antarcticum]